MEAVEEEQNKGGFGQWLKNLFGGSGEEEEEEQPTYSRKLLDGRIEKYLDQNMDSYISEYGIVTELDLESYETRYEDLTGRISEMKDYMIGADAKVSSMEKDLEVVKKASKKKK